MPMECNFTRRSLLCMDGARTSQIQSGTTVTQRPLAGRGRRSRRPLARVGDSHLRVAYEVQLGFENPVNPVHRPSGHANAA